MDSVRGALLVLISIAGGMPMFAWLLLGGTGSLGEFGNTEAYEIIKIVLIVITMVFYFVISPFVIWPRLLNREPDQGKGNGS